MIGRTSLHSEVVHSRHYPASEERGPLSIDDNPRGQRILRTHQPMCETETILRQISGPRMQDLRRCRCYFFLRLQVFASMMPIGWTRIIDGTLLHDKCLGDGGPHAEFSNVFDLGCQFRCRQEELLPQGVIFVGPTFICGK